MSGPTCTRPDWSTAERDACDCDWFPLPFWTTACDECVYFKAGDDE